MAPADVCREVKALVDAGEAVEFHRQTENAPVPVARVREEDNDKRLRDIAPANESQVTIRVWKNTLEHVLTGRGGQLREIMQWSSSSAFLFCLCPGCQEPHFPSRGAPDPLPRAVQITIVSSSYPFVVYLFFQLIYCYQHTRMNR